MITQAEPANTLLTIDDVAQRVGVSRTAVQNWVKARSIPTVRINQKVIRFLPDDVDHWLAAHRVSDQLQNRITN